MAKKLWILYDDRARTESTDAAAVLSSSSSLKEAKRDQRDIGGVIFEYDVAEGNKLVNERQVG